MWVKLHSGQSNGTVITRRGVATCNPPHASSPYAETHIRRGSTRPPSLCRHTFHTPHGPMEDSAELFQG
eukprot:3700486-Pyramimonas_sp.AAC.1